MKHTSTILLALLLLLTGCHDKPTEPELYGLLGAWTLSKIVYPIGTEKNYPIEGNTFCRIFCKDTTFYDCQLLSTPTGIVVIPKEKGDFEVIDRGHGAPLYFENGHPRPLKRVNDTTMVIQKYGAEYTWILNRSMSESRQKELRSIIENDEGNANEQVMLYVLSTSEKELKATNHFLAYLIVALAVAIMLIMAYVFRLFHHKKQIEEKLRRITEEQSLRPQVVQHALEQVEGEFFRSDYFTSLHRRISGGSLLKEEDWEAMEQAMKPVYPDLFRQLPGLCRMSQVEYRVCLLIKLRFSPSEMAGVLCKDISTISSIRSRLYKKVFNRSGGTKGWDDFILSL